MFRVQRSVLIERPLEEVFAFLSDFEKGMLWRRELRWIQRVEGEDSRPGAKFLQEIDWQEGVSRSTLTVLTVEPSLLIEFEGDSEDLVGTATYEFTAGPGSDQTRLDVAARLDAKRGLRALEPLLRVAIMRQGDIDLDALKDLLDTYGESGVGEM